MREHLSRRACLGAGVTGLSLVLGGCTSPSGTTGSESTAGPSSSATSRRDTTSVRLRWLTTPGIEDSADEIRQLLRRAGLPERISLSFESPQNVLRWDDIETALADEEPVDLVTLTDPVWTTRLAASDRLHDLRDFLSASTVSTVTTDTYPGGLDPVLGPREQLYGVPLNTMGSLMLYRRDLLEAAGFRPTSWDSPLSWTRFAEVARRTVEETSVSHGYVFDGEPGLVSPTVDSWIRSYGGAYFGDETQFLDDPREVATVTEQPVLDALRMGRAFLYGQSDDHALSGVAGPIAPTDVLNWGPQQSLRAFVGQQSAVFHSNGSFGVTDAVSELGDSVGVMRLPYGVASDARRYRFTGGSRTPLDSLAVGVPTQSAEPNAGGDVLRTLFAESVQRSLNDRWGTWPARPSLSDAIPDLLPSYRETAERAAETGAPAPALREWPTVGRTIQTRVQSVFQQSNSPTASMGELRRKL